MIAAFSAKESRDDDHPTDDNKQHFCRRDSELSHMFFS